MSSARQGPSRSVRVAPTKSDHVTVTAGGTVSASVLPPELLVLVLASRELPPQSLAVCCCVCREWRAVASATSMWRIHAEQAQRKLRALTSGPPGERTQQGASAVASADLEFAADSTKLFNDTADGACGSSSWREVYVAADTELRWRTGQMLQH
eukprot:jgi/Chlat1/7105/Chrsp57S06793